MLEHALATNAPKIKYNTSSFFLFFLYCSLFLSEKSLSSYKKYFLILLQGLLGSADQIGKLIFGKLILTRFWGVLCQPVHPESNIRLSRSFSLFDSPPTFFPKTGLQVRMSNFKTILAPFLGSFPVSRQDLVNLYWPDFGVCSANQCTQNQI